jgi:hypothetical protein
VHTKLSWPFQKLSRDLFTVPPLSLPAAGFPFPDGFLKFSSCATKFSLVANPYSLFFRFQLLIHLFPAPVFLFSVAASLLYDLTEKRS